MSAAIPTYIQLHCVIRVADVPICAQTAGYNDPSFVFPQPVCGRRFILREYKTVSAVWHDDTAAILNTSE